MRLRCRLGFHEFGLSTVKEVAPDIFIARTACLHCPREMFGDPDQIHSTRFQPGELNKMNLPQEILDADAEHHARAFDGAFNHMMDEADFYAGNVPTPPTAVARNDVPPTPGFYHYDYAIKSWPAFFSKMITGEKKHDMRDKSERTYAVGDRVLLQEYDPFGGGYTGRCALFEITYITSNDTPCAMSSNALARDACILSVSLIEILEIVQ